MPSFIERRIVCAAIKSVTLDPIIISGVRHYDLGMTCQALRCAAETDGVKWEQGFLDNQGEFVTREDAWKIALKARQILRRVPGDNKNDGTLFSENLY